MDSSTLTTDPGARGAPDPLAVPLTVIDSPAGVDEFAAAVASATVVAVDTETWGFTDSFEGHMRVLSAATRDAAGVERAWVVDARDVDPTLLADALRGATVIGWNANFDSRVIDRAVFGIDVALSPLKWWDAMLADATYNQGRFGFTWYHGLATAAHRFLGITMSGKGSVQTSFDRSSDLSAAQIAYAAADAVTTLWVYDALIGRIAEAGLVDKVADVMRGRPFLDLMERAGMPFDWAAWCDYLNGLKVEAEKLLGELAELTGGGQGNLFSEFATPSWKPNSADDVRDVLNRFCPDEVRAYFERATKQSRLFESTDSTDKDTLKQIDSELARTLLAYRDRTKILSTYGESLEQWIADDGRIHSEYLFEVGTDTGRLSSRRPNAQNWTPRAKKYMRTMDQNRVIIHADYSQAELRFLAAISGDEAMLTAFREGRDIHVATAERMFNVDMEELSGSDPKAYKAYRSKAKTLNFGIVYGLGARALALRLTLGGVPCDEREAKALLASYLESYPQVAAWLADRDRFIRGLANDPPRVDLAATLRMRTLFPLVTTTVKSLAAQSGAVPDNETLAREVFARDEVVAALTEANGSAPTDDEVATHYAGALADEVGRVRANEGSVVIGRNGAPLVFESRTPRGSRRVFEIGCDQLLFEMAVISLRRLKPGPKVAEFCQRHGVEFYANGRLVSFERLKKVFEDRQLRRAWVEFLVEAKGQAYGDELATEAYASMVGSLGNAYRNHPIQGGVADVATAAFGRLAEVLGEFPTAVPVQTVHDSIVIECDRADAVALGFAVKAAMEDVFTELRPGVAPKADADIRVSFDDEDVIFELETPPAVSDEELAAFIAETTETFLKEHAVVG
jgi:DNA polymerase I-like protein with 3'-5' exonuclease and polymerase domains